MKKKGFTLIELLAVIIILAIILVIAVPKILEVIENTEKRSYKESVELMVHTAKLQYQTQEIQGTAAEIPEGGIIYRYGESASDTIQTNVEEVGLLNFKGDKPSSGTITLKTSKTVEVDQLVSKNKKWCAKKAENGEVQVGKVGDEGYNCAVDSSEEASVDDEPCVLATETKDDKEYYYIDSVEDMYAFSDNVNSGNTYEGKIVKLRTNLNFSNYTSDKKAKVCKDNDNENGFTPIGTFSNSFSGTFEGNAKTISNLTINRPNQDYVGIFGVARSDKIVGLIIKNTKITGGTKSSTLVGEDFSGIINEICLDNVELTTTNNNAGILLGDLHGGQRSNILVKNSKINASYVNLLRNIGYSGWGNGIVENSEINATSASLGTDYYSNNVKINGNTQTNGFSPSNVNDLNYYETIGLDTWIDGDDDNSGYYFDYDTNGKVTLKSIVDYPLPTSEDSTFSKEGDYYLINNASDWKKLSAFATKGLTVKLGNDIDFTNQKYYMLGSYYNNYTGTFNGGAKTISGIQINAEKGNYIGLFGKTYNANIKGLNITNVKIKAGEKSSTLAGDTTYGVIDEICLDNIELSTTGNSAGALVGDLHSGDRYNVLVKNVKINADYISSYMRNIDDSIIESSDINAQSAAISTYNVYYSNAVKINGTTVTDGFDTSKIGDLEYYSGKLETILDNDSNNTGYSFGYDINKDGVYVVPRKKTGWQLINNKEPLTSQKWVYFNSDGTRIQSGLQTLKDFSNNDQQYYFENGVAVLGLKEINGNTYYFSTSDTQPTNGYVDANMIHNQTIMIGATPYTFGSDGKCTNCN